MEFITLKEENFIDYDESEMESVITEFTHKTGKETDTIKFQKKCGEIFICEEDVFNFLCTLCEAPFDKVERFFSHIKLSHKNINCIDMIDPLEPHEDGNQCEDIKNELDIQKSITENFENVNETNITNKRNLETFEIQEKEIEEINKQKSSSLIENDRMCQSGLNENIGKKSKNLENKVFCDVCNKKFNSERTLQRHKKSEHPKKTTNSKVQYKIETNEKDKEKSVANEKTSSENDPLKHKYCGHRLADTSVLKDHKRIHSDEKPYQCQKCGKQFQSRKYVCRHEKTCRQFKCDKCDMTLKSKGELSAHMRGHGEKQFACSYCDKQYHRKTSKIEHERIHTGEKPFQCKTCGKQFRTKSLLLEHELSHSNIEQFKCDKCDKAFKRKSGLFAHKRRHGEKKFACSYCDKRFHTKNVKIEHERTHTGEKPHKCNYCGKSFAWKLHLNVHNRSHTGIRPYQCQYCDRCFAIKSRLDNHVVIHTGERPFVCTTCNATFSRKPALKLHKNIHLDSRRFVCKICGKTFDQYPTLRGHMKRHKRLLEKSGEVKSEIPDSESTL